MASAFFFELGLFSLKTLILVLLIFGGIVAILIVAAKGKRSSAAIEVRDLTKELEDQSRHIKAAIATPLELNALKKENKITKKHKKLEKKEPAKPRTFVLEFNGDVKASQVDNFKKLITTVLSVSDHTKDEVVICLESPGGMVHTYGLAAAQILRLREKGFHVVASVDKVAASGGYLMAVVAHEIIASPFAILGSIGVVAQVPNLHRLLKKNNIDYEEMTSGEHKRTVSVLGEITEEGRKHFEGKLKDTHQLFKNFVKEFRPHLDLSKVADGDHWFGKEALELGLIDRIQTSDDLILAKSKDRQIIKLSISDKKKLPQKLAEAMQMVFENILSRFILKS